MIEKILSNNVFDDAVDLVNRYLLSNESISLAQTLLCAVIVFATCAILLYVGANFTQVFFGEFLIICFLTGIGWLPGAILVIMVMIIVIGFTKPIVDAITATVSSLRSKE